MSVPTRLLATGVLIAIGFSSQRANAATPPPTSCVPGFAYGAFGKTSLDFGGTSDTDSWNSSVAPYTYAGTVSSSGGSLGTNGSMVLHGNPTARGDAFYGSSGTVTLSGGPTVTGTTAAQTTNIPVPSVTIPTLGSNLGACASCAITANNTYTTVSGTVTFPAGTYVIGTLTANVIVNTGPVLIYISGSWTPSTISNTTLVPGKLVFMAGPSVPNFSLNTVDGYYAVYAPDSDIDVHSGTQIYGAIVANNIDKITGHPFIHYDRALANFSGGGFSCAGIETSRASPVVALGTTTSGLTNATGDNGYIVQGSFERPTGTAATIGSIAAIAGFTFPFVKGHMRARLTSDITTTATSFSAGTVSTVLFDAATTGLIPTPTFGGCTSKTGTCRNIFTVVSSPSATTGLQFHPTTTQFNDTNAAAIGALMTSITSLTPSVANYQSILHTVLGGVLGGVDRSTVAVIQPSTVAGVSSRPTMAYFGATDGMLHAVCATKNGTTPTATGICSANFGTELWAFMPRTQVALIPTNGTRIDGSIRVMDMFGDFNSPTTGVKSWRTILFFQTGFATTGAPPATYALDVTDPATPVVLWEYTTPTSGVGSPDLGTGLTVAAGPVQIGGQLRNVAVIETNNGGTGTQGVFVTAVYAESGAKVWSSNFGYLYGANGVGVTGSTAASPRTVAADAPVAQYGVPGGVVGVDLLSNGYFTDFVFGDLYGDLWRINAATGASRNGTNTPLFSFSTNKHPIGAPPAIYSSNAKQIAAFFSGGYADTTGAQWATGTQYLIGLDLAYTGATLNETTAATTTGTVRLNTSTTTLGISGENGFSQAIVVGSQLFVTTDSANINSSTYGTSTANTGHLTTVDLTGVAATTTVATRAGGSSLVNNGTTLYGSSSDKQQQMATATSTTGTSVDLANTPKLTRNLWLRTQ